MAEQTVLVDRRDGFHLLTLNRPDKLNSFNDAMHAELMAALVTAENDDACRAIVLTGAGRGFCAGQDLGDRVSPDASDGPPDLSESIETRYNPLVRKLRSLPFPIVCAVNGVAAGAGANLALGCDIVLAGRSAKFIQAFSKIGLVPDSGGTWLLPRLVGMPRARALALLAEPVSAEQAEDWGMIWKAVDDDVLMDTALTMVARLAEGPTLGYSFIKQALDAAETNSLDDQLELECRLQGEAGRSPDYAEGVRAFMAKRPPKFTGRR
ncbi:2-(1,2-epoxy-1,2-dihydrophenyl)acetyl-CoA isomerase PaaG [Coralliovum pocilloporae]|uniref:2-(1,2-epoxy-1,2-dihydrophenyl)acetyl-CoA isomerase PaaG n=1 Tax=Coralliovum pocilloporae TaxID=3066369 RepID=UPI003306D55C